MRYSIDPSVENMKKVVDFYLLLKILLKISAKT